jgi:hypothetical protein
MVSETLKVLKMLNMRDKILSWDILTRIGLDLVLWERFSSANYPKINLQDSFWQYTNWNVLNSLIVFKSFTIYNVYIAQDLRQSCVRIIAALQDFVV